MKNKIKRVDESEKKRNPAYKKILIVMAVIFTLYSLTLILPFLWLVMNSLKGSVAFSFATISISKEKRVPL